MINLKLKLDMCNLLNTSVIYKRIMIKMLEQNKHGGKMLLIYSFREINFAQIQCGAN